jgi:predicted AAA+ superfamily ATPase
MRTVRDWVAILHQFYYSFPLLPYSTSLTRALRKASKVYLFDWSEVPEESLRLENMVALHLHKAVATWNARGEGHVAVQLVGKQGICRKLTTDVGILWVISADRWLRALP